MKLTLLPTVLVIAGLTLSAGSASAYQTTAKTATSVHADSKASAKKVGALKAGEKIEVTNCRLFWCFVQHKGTDGWVRRGKLIEPKSSGNLMYGNDSGGSGGGGGGGGGGGAGNAGNAGGIGTAAQGGMIAEFFRNLFAN